MVYHGPEVRTDIEGGSIMADGSADLWERLGEFVNQLMDQKQVPGVGLGIALGNKTWSTGFGVTSVENPLPVTDTTLFQIGSITKTFVGTALMRLAERDDVDLGASVRTYIPDFLVSDTAASTGATIRHLLTHTAGWAGDFFHGTGDGPDALARYVADMAELPQLAPLGAHWSYNNSGFAVAGRILELVTGMPFEEALAELVLTPLGLEQTYLDPGEVMTRRFAVGHSGGDDGPQVARPWVLGRSIYPMGGLVCHVLDLLRYARFHLGDGRPVGGGEPLLTRKSLALMQTPQVLVRGTEAWGLPWSVVEHARLGSNGGTRARLISHGGGTKGQTSLLALVPEHDFALVVLTNADTGSALYDELRRWVLREFLALEDPEPEAMETSPEDLAVYEGRYRSFFTNWELGMLNGRLVGQAVYNRGFPNESVPPPPAPPPVSLGFCEEDRLLALDGSGKGDRADVIRNEDGTIGWLRISGRLHVRSE
jgi:CubicO group peptidase (beta-lactamase class C family)